MVEGAHVEDPTQLGISALMHRNVLITSAGRRGKLLNAFKRELAALIPSGQVYAADLRPELSAGCQLADASFAMPHVNEPDYVARLRELCVDRQIGLVVPTIDTELAVLSLAREELAAKGTQIAVSDASFIRICRDKRTTSSWFQSRGLDVPKSIDARNSATFPIFVKPCDGSSGQGAGIITSSHELTPALIADARMMFLEYLSPADYEEYSIDMYYSRSGGLKCLVPRLRLETRAGEVSKSRTARIDAMSMLQERLRQIAGVRGCITLQIFVQRNSGKFYASEINPRFGGGYPLSYETGANFPRWLLEEYLLGRPVEFYDDWESNVTMLRYDEHVVVRGAAA